MRLVVRLSFLTLAALTLCNTFIQHAMVCAFVTSREYQQRFRSIVTHTNAECDQ
jgi:hypothetical protein